MNKTLTLLTSVLLAVPVFASAQTAPAAPATTPATTPAPATTTTPAVTTATPTTPVPARRTKTPRTPKATKPLPTSIVHVNSASVQDLLTLPEVTPKIADSIVKNRPYKDVNDFVKKVKGIGPKNVKKIQAYIDFK